MGETGLLLVTGPFKLNGTPLRRVNQGFLLATSTKIDVSGVKVPDTINDKYFARIRLRRPPRRRETSLMARRKDTNHPSRGRRIRLLSTHRFWLQSRQTRRDKL